MTDRTDWVEDAYTFLFYEDSVASNLAFAAVAFVVIKYIVFPVIGAIAGTPLPIVAVISDSMEHEQGWWESQADCPARNCTQQQYYAQYNVSQDDFEAFPFDDGFNRGDIMLVQGYGAYEQGDVVVYSAAGRPPVIHRVVESRPSSLLVKGDANPRPLDQLGETNLARQRVMGKAYARIPYLGYVKLVIVDIARRIAGVFL